MKPMFRLFSLFLFLGAGSPLVAQNINPLNQSGAPQARARAEAPSAGGMAPAVLGAVRNFHAVSKGIEIEAENGRLQITALEDNVIRVRAIHGSQFFLKNSY